MYMKTYMHIFEYIYIYIFNLYLQINLSDYRRQECIGQISWIKFWVLEQALGLEASQASY